MIDLSAAKKAFQDFMARGQKPLPLTKAMQDRPEILKSDLQKSVDAYKTWCRRNGQA